MIKSINSFHFTETFILKFISLLKYVIIWDILGGVIVKEKYIKLFGNLFMIGTVLGTLLMATFYYKSSYLLTYCMAIPLVVAPFILKKQFLN